MKSTNKNGLRLVILLTVALIGYATSASAAPYVYTSLPFSDSVSVIDPSTNTLVPQSPVPVCSNPSGLAATPNGAKVYVACLNAPFVYVIETTTHTVTATVSLPLGSRSQEIAITPDGSKAYVVIQDSNAVGVIRTSDNTHIGTITGFNSPHGIAITPTGSKAYVTNHGESGGGTTVSVINLATNTIAAIVTVGQAPIGVVVASDGKKAYVANSVSNSVSVIDTVMDNVITTISSLFSIQHIGSSPDGDEVWVPNSNGLSIIDTSTDSLHSILKFFQVDITGMFRMTSSARYFKEGVGSSRPT